jgi:hypothetical protein
MVTVPGVASAQRFKTATRNYSPSLALYSMASGEIFKDPYGFPSPVHWEKFADAWTKSNYGTYFWNSTIVVVVAVPVVFVSPVMVIAVAVLIVERDAEPLRDGAGLWERAIYHVRARRYEAAHATLSSSGVPRWGIPSVPIFRNSSGLAKHFLTAKKLASRS